MLRKAVPEVLHQFRGKVADPRGAKIGVKVQRKSARKVYNRACKRLVHRHIGVSVAHNVGLVSQGFPARLSKNDPDILDAVVFVHMEVTAAADCKVKLPVFREQIQHVIQEAHASCIVK